MAVRAWSRGPRAEPLRSKGGPEDQKPHHGGRARADVRRRRRVGRFRRLSPGRARRQAPLLSGPCCCPPTPRGSGPPTGSPVPAGFEAEEAAFEAVCGELHTDRKPRSGVGRQRHGHGGRASHVERHGERRAVEDRVDPAEAVQRPRALGIGAEGRGKLRRGRGEQDVVGVEGPGQAAGDPVADRESRDELGAADALPVVVARVAGSRVEESTGRPKAAASSSTVAARFAVNRRALARTYSSQPTPRPTSASSTWWPRSASRAAVRERASATGALVRRPPHAWARTPIRSFPGDG